MSKRNVAHLKTNIQKWDALSFTPALTLMVGDSHVF